MRVVAGVDCHKSTHTAVFIDAVGHVIDRITFPTTEEGYERALAVRRRLERHRRHSSRRGKSDETDAHAIAEVVLREADRLPGFHPSVLQRALRLSYDRRDRLVRERTRAVNRLRMAAVLLGVVELPRDLTSRRAARLVADMAIRFRDEVRLHAAASAIVDDLQDAAEEILPGCTHATLGSSSKVSTCSPISGMCRFEIKQDKTSTSRRTGSPSC